MAIIQKQQRINAPVFFRDEQKKTPHFRKYLNGSTVSGIQRKKSAQAYKNIVFLR